MTDAWDQRIAAQVFDIGRHRFQSLGGHNNDTVFVTCCEQGRLVNLCGCTGGELPG